MEPEKGKSYIFAQGFCGIIYGWFGGEDRFVILTTVANELMIGTHDRMLLVLEEGQVKDWIFCQDRAEEILKRVPILLEKRIKYEQQLLLFGWE